MRKEASAKFQSRCSVCGSTIHPGDLITYDPAIKYSTRHKLCPVKQNTAPIVAPGTLLNSPVIAPTQIARLADEAAESILAEIGSAFIRPLPEGIPTLGLGSKVTINGKERTVGHCNRWVGAVTDFDAKESWALSLIDGRILEHFPAPEGWRRAPIQRLARQMGAPVSMERSGKHSVKVGEVFKDEQIWFIVEAVDKPYFLSAEDAEDFDMFDRGGGWATTFEAREIVEPIKEREKREAKEAARLAEATAKKQAKADFDATFQEMTSGLIAVSNAAWEVVTDDGQPPYVASWSDGSNYAQLKLTKSKLTGKAAVIYPHGGYDDYRLTMFLDQETAYAAFEARRARSQNSSRPDTPATAREWLKKYSQCHGSEYYVWLSDQEENT